MTSRFLPTVLAGLLMAGAADAATLVGNSTTGYYNAGIGTALDGTNPFGGNNMFPLADVSGGDPSLDIPASSEPDLSTAAGALGTWLGTAAPSGGAWSAAPVAIPAAWAVNTETAISYMLDGGAGGLANIVASFGVDNGIFVWLDGVFQGGFLRPGGASAGEHVFNLGSVGAGMHYLQILREDHGSAADYSVSVTGDLIPAPVPLPATALLMIAGLGGLGAMARRKRA